jgi:tetratricopeptide (TPR) repeat protein
METPFLTTIKNQLAKRTKNELLQLITERKQDTSLDITQVKGTTWEEKVANATQLCEYLAAEKQVLRYHDDDRRYSIDEQILVIAKQYDIRYWILRCLKTLSTIVKDLQRKHAYIEEAFTFCVAPIDFATFYIEFVRYYIDTGDYPQMIVYAQKAQEYLDSCSEQEQQSTHFIRCFWDLIFYYIQYHNRTQNYAKVLEYCSIAQEFVHSREKQLHPMRYNDLIAQVLYANATGLAAIGNRKQAITDLHEALRRSINPVLTEQSYRIHFNLASLYLDEGNAEEALHHVTIAQQGLSKQSYSELAHAISILQGDIERHNNNIPAAEEYYQQAYNNIHEASTVDNYILSELLKHWALLYEQAGNFEKALQKYKEYHEALLQFNNNTLQSKVAELDTRHTAELLRQENGFLEKEKQQLRKEKEQGIRKFKRFSKNYHTLQGELKGMRLDFQEFLHRTSVETNSAEPFLERIDTLQKLLHKHCDEELKFEIPQDFYKDLEAVALEPLNSTEKSVAALIYSKFSTKQMPSVLHRSEGHLLHVRRALRQKLPIPKDQNLKTFIQRL